MSTVDEEQAELAAETASKHGRPRLFIKKPEVLPPVFLDVVPTSIPAGRVFVHDVAAQTHGGVVRYWHAHQGAKGLRVCGCALAPSLGIHFKAGR